MSDGGFPSTLSDLEWADATIRRDRGSSTTSPAARTLSLTPLPIDDADARDADVDDAASASASTTASAESNASSRSGGGGGVGGEWRRERMSLSSSSRRDMYQEAARRSTGVAVSVRSVWSEGSSTSASSLIRKEGGGGGGGGKNRDSGGRRVRSGGGGNGGAGEDGSVKISNAARRLSVTRRSSCGGGSVASVPDEAATATAPDERTIPEVEYMDEVTFARPEDEAGFDDRGDDSGVKGRGKNGKLGGVVCREDEEKGLGGGHPEWDDSDEQLESFNARLSKTSSGRTSSSSSSSCSSSGDRNEKMYSHSDDPGEANSFAEFSLNLRRVTGKVCPKCGYVDCQECCRNCRGCDCCSATVIAACADRSSQRWCAAGFVAAALIVATLALLRGVGGGHSSGGTAALPPPPEAVRLPAYLEDNLADRSDFVAGVASADAEIASSDDVPLLWTAPLSDPSLLRDIFGECYGLVQATDPGFAAVPNEEDSLRIVDEGGSSYLNVDLSSPAGLERAAVLDIASSGEADVLSTPLLHGVASSVLDPEHRGLLMAVFRHPVHRVAAEYRFLSGDGVAAGMTLEGYATSDLSMDDFVTRRLVLGDDPDTGRELTEIELVLAKEILRRKAVVGLYEDLPSAVRHFANAFGFDDESRDAQGCVQALVDEVATADSEGASDVEEGTEAWRTIADRNRYDMALYEYAMELYLYQAGASARR